MLSNVAVLAFDGVKPFELGLLCDAFGSGAADGIPAIDFAVCAPTSDPLRTSHGFTIQADSDLGRLAEADLVAVPASVQPDDPPESVIAALQAAVARGARVLSACTGAFTLGAARLLDGRECTTHWMDAEALQQRFPLARVLPEVLCVDAGQVVTSAGSAAGIDACLHLWRQEHGAAVAAAVARRMVVPPHRDGGQAQFIARAVPACDAEALGPLLTWILEHLDEEHGVESLARRAHMSPRTFARRFRDETGTTPHAWVTKQRVLAAEELLEQSDEPVERIAQRVGFANAATLRAHFRRQRGVSPQAYRRGFACTPTEAMG